MKTKYIFLIYLLFIFPTLFSQVSFENAKNFMKKRCENISQEYLDGYETQFDGVKTYLFLTRNGEKYCSSLVSDRKLEVLAADCGGIEKKVEFEKIISLNSKSKKEEISREKQNESILHDIKIKQKIDSLLLEEKYFLALAYYELLNNEDEKLRVNCKYLTDSETKNIQNQYENYIRDCSILKNEYLKDSKLFINNLGFQGKIDSISLGFLDNSTNRLRSNEYYLGLGDFYVKRIDFEEINNFIKKEKNEFKKIYLQNLKKEISSNSYSYYFGSYDNNPSHLIIPVSPSGNYYLNRYDYDFVDTIGIKFIYDSVIQRYRGVINFYKQNSIINTGHIINSFWVNIPVLSCSFPEKFQKLIKFRNEESSEINSILTDIDTISRIWSLEYQEYQIEILNEMKFSIKEMKKNFPPENGYINDKFEKLKLRLSSHVRDGYGSGSEEKIDSYLKKSNALDIYSKFYNPILLNLVKQLYPYADSVIFCLGNDMEHVLKNSALHFKYGSLIPLQKGVIELNGDLLKIYNATGDYKIINKINYPFPSRVSLIDFNIDSVNIPSEFIDEDGYMNEFFFKKIIISEKWFDNNAWKTPSHFISNNILIIPIYSVNENSKINGITLKTKNNGWGNCSYFWYYDEFAGYLINMKIYLAYKKAGQLREAEHYLKKAEKAIRKFKTYYLESK